MALPFEIILRLASVLGRNDPISFVMRFTRSYNPDVWKTLESLGIGRLALRPDASASSPTCTAAATPRGASPMKTSPRC